jgi:hypothetical protein
VKQQATFNQVIQFRKLSQLLVKKHLRVDLLSPEYLIKNVWNLLQERPTAILVGWFLLAVYVYIDMDMK